MYQHITLFNFLLYYQHRTTIILHLFQSSKTTHFVRVFYVYRFKLYVYLQWFVSKTTLGNKLPLTLFILDYVAMSLQYEEAVETVFLPIRNVNENSTQLTYVYCNKN